VGGLKRCQKHDNCINTRDKLTTLHYLIQQTTVYKHCFSSQVAFSALTLLDGHQEEHPASDVVLDVGPWSLAVLKDKVPVIGPGLGLETAVLVNITHFCTHFFTGVSL